MKRIISALLILIMMIPPMVLPAQAATEVAIQPEAKVWVDADNTEDVKPGDEVTISVKYENIPACGSFDFSLVYDPQYFETLTDSNLSSNLVADYGAQNVVYTMEEPAELVGKKAVKLVGVGEANCLPVSNETLFTVKFVVKEEAPNPPEPGIPFEFVGSFYNLYSGKDMRNIIEVVNTHITTATDEKSVTNVSLSKLPNKLKYVEGQALNMEGGLLEVTYSDGTQDYVRLSMAEVTEIAVNQSEPEKQTVKAEYAGYEVSFEIQTNAKRFTAISVGKMPKAEYIKGTEKLEGTGGVLLLHYNTNDGTGGLIETLDMTDPSITLSGYDSNVLGVQEIKVEYGGYETYYKIAVVEKALKKIDVRTPMICSSCNMELDAIELITNAGGTSKNTATFSSRQEFFEKNEGTISCLNSECSGKTFTPKMKMVYYLGEDFDVNFENVKLFVTYSGGSTEYLPLTLDMVDFNNTIPTTQYVEVTYGSQSTSIPNVQTKKKSVSKISIHQEPQNTTYIQGQPFDTTGGEILVTYVDGSEEVISMGRADVGIYYSNLNELGEHKITVQYRYAQASFKVYVKPREVESVEVDPKAKSIYIQGEELDPNIKLFVTYNDGKTKTAYLRDAKVTGYDADTPGTHEVIVTYGQKESLPWPVTVERKVMETLEIEGTPPTTILEGTELNLEGCTLTATYNNGDVVRDIAITPNMIRFNQQAGTQTVTVTYTDTYDNKKEVTFDITVRPKSIIAIEAVGVQNQYLLDEVLDRSVGKIKLIYDNGTFDEIDFSNEDVSVEGFRSDAVGEYTVTVGYQNFTTTYTVSVYMEIISILVTPPAKSEYKEGERLDLTGGEVKITHSNGTKVVPLTSAMISNYDSYNPYQIGVQTFTVTVGDKTETFSVTVKEKQLTGITVSPETIDHNEWEDLDLSQVVITAVYDNNTTEPLNPNDVEKTEYDTYVLYTYEGKTAKLGVNIIKEVPISIEWKTQPKKTSYIQGQPLLKDGEILVHYNNPDKKVPLLLTDVTDADLRFIGGTETVGEQVIYVLYKELPSIRYEITVEPIVVNKIEIIGTLPTTILEETKLNLEDCTLTVTYNDGEVLENIAITPNMIQFNQRVGTQTVTVTYTDRYGTYGNNIEVTFDINVRAKTAQKIRMTALPKTLYLEGKDTALDLEGGKITVFYDNNTTAVVYLTDPLVKVSGFDKAVLGKQTITVSYPGVDSVTFDIIMNKKEVSGIALAGLPTKMMYRQGVEKFDPAGGLITVFYNNDTKETIDLSKAKISGFSNLFAGDVTVTAAYEGYAVEFKVMILTENPFNDVEEGIDVYYEVPVLWAVTKGITTGTSETTFAPEDECTRAQIVTFLWRAAGEPKASADTEVSFADIEEGSYYYDAVVWAGENGITAGIDATHFAPDSACTRGQVATFLWRAENKPAAENSNNPFTDLEVGEYYYDAVLWAVENGITNGMTDTTFAPNSTCTRGHIVTFLYRTYK